MQVSPHVMGRQFSSLESVIFVANVRDQGWKAKILHMFVLGSLYVLYCIFNQLTLSKNMPMADGSLILVDYTA